MLEHVLEGRLMEGGTCESVRTPSLVLSNDFPLPLLWGPLCSVNRLNKNSWLPGGNFGLSLGIYDEGTVYISLDGKGILTSFRQETMNVDEYVLVQIMCR